MKKLLLALCMFLLLTSFGNAASVLDFEDLTVPNPLPTAPLEGFMSDYHGFDFTTDPWKWQYGPTAYYPYEGIGTDGNFSIKRSTFDAMSIRKAEGFYFLGADILPNADSNGDYVSITGIYQGDYQNPVFYEEAVWTDLTPRFVFDSFGDKLVDEVRFYSWGSGANQAFVMDNFTYDPVPIPGAVWLLGTGLIGLIATRCKTSLKK
ncbi:MAG: hypothetical protein GY699_04825 [Desulfobacteraceae bacterium]|nr:hypothetical protein [Desulfobacteraceae bacterium]